jgi:hypothetical protein
MAVVRLALMQLDALFGRKPHLAQEAINVAFGDGDLEFGEEMLPEPVGGPTVKAVAKDFGAMGNEVFESIEVGLIDGFGPPDGLGWGIGGVGRSGLIGVLTLGHSVILLNVTEVKLCPNLRPKLGLKIWNLGVEKTKFSVPY